MGQGKFQHDLLRIIPFGILFSVVALFVSFTNASVPSVTPTNSAPSGFLLFATSDGSIDTERLSPDAGLPQSDFGGSAAGYRKELFLSSNRDVVVVTMTPIEFEGDSMTYLADIHGKNLTLPQFGSFISWSPDSSKALLYVSTMNAPWDRYIYALDVDGDYYDIGLPNGTISADISPLDGSIAYSLTSGGTDDSTIYIRDPQGHDRIFRSEKGKILTWIRWAPDGSKIVYMQSNLLINDGDQSVWMANPDGTGVERVSQIIWNYPPAWSPDATKIAFSNKGDIWEYVVDTKSFNNVTDEVVDSAEHPTYSADGESIVFSAEGRIWKWESGNVIPITNDNQQKDYPILP